MDIGIIPGPLGAYTTAPPVKSVSVDPAATGALYTVARLLGPTSMLSLASGTNPNLSLSGATIQAASALGAGTRQKAVVRESLDQIAIEYPVLLSAPISNP